MDVKCNPSPLEIPPLGGGGRTLHLRKEQAISELILMPTTCLRLSTRTSKDVLYLQTQQSSRFCNLLAPGRQVQYIAIGNPTSRRWGPNSSPSQGASHKRIDFDAHNIPSFVNPHFQGRTVPTSATIKPILQTVDPWTSRATHRHWKSHLSAVGAELFTFTRNKP